MACLSQPAQALGENLLDQIGITVKQENKAIAASVSKRSAYGRDFPVREMGYDYDVVECGYGRAGAFWK